MKTLIKRTAPNSLLDFLSYMRQRRRLSNIVQPIGSLNPLDGNKTLVMVVGPAFDQNRPDAMMTCRMGYCHAFEDLGIPYLIADIRTLPEVLAQVPSPFLMYFAGDLKFLPKNDIRVVRHHPSAIWTYPWFEKSDIFFSTHGLDARIWTLSKFCIEKVFELRPRFCFTATMPSGLNFFELWEKNGISIKSFPLACDTRIYNIDSANKAAFEDVSMAFVGGYWASKGKQIDEYLRQFENRLEIYGYNQWPYAGYRGMLPGDLEASLYAAARVCPIVNEPTVALLSGQINERVFKVLGSFGCPVVDAVPAYRELYSEDELMVSESPEHFAFLVELLLHDEDLNRSYRENGRKATLARHTYFHRARAYLNALEMKGD